jgi:hydrogenase/urease accessory protein HupE
MNHMLATLAVIGIGALLAVRAHGQSTDALIVLTTVGYLTGAADGCKVAAAESNALSGGMALAISKGKYGDQAQAHTLLNNARQRGIANAAAGKVNCAKVSESVREQVRSLMGK